MKKLLLSTVLLLTSSIGLYSQSAEIVLPEEYHFEESRRASRVKQACAPYPAMLTGAVEFDLPLYELEAYGWSIPLSLKYRSNGLKVDDTPYPFGYGWELMPALRVYRYVYGRPDEYFTALGDAVSMDDYQLDYCCITDSVTNFSSPTDHRLRVDPQPDIFHIMLPDKVIRVCRIDGKFYGANVGEYRIQSDGSLNYISVTDPKGNIYYFGTPGENCNEGRYRTEWLLSYILLENGQKIEFDWNQDSVHQGDLYFGGTVLFSGGRSSVSSKTELQKVLYKGGRELTGIRLNRISVKFGYETSDGNVLLKSFEVHHGDSLVVGGSFVYGRNEGKMLLLKEAGISRKGNYKFEYDESGFESRMSQDWWGYHNGKNKSVGILSPSVYIDKIGSTPINKTIPGADRSIDEISMQAGILRAVKLPSGGRIEWEYETHFLKQPSSFPALSGISISETVPDKGAGLRLSCVRMIDNISQDTVSEIRYEYGLSGDGKARCSAIPTLSSFIDTRDILGYYEDAPGSRFLRTDKFIRVRPRPYLPEIELGGLPVWYEEVSEVFHEGKTVHKFDKILPDNLCLPSGSYPYEVYSLFSGWPVATRTETYSGRDAAYNLVQTDEYLYSTVPSRTVAGRHIERRVVQTQEAANRPDFAFTDDFLFRTPLPTSITAGMRVADGNVKDIGSYHVYSSTELAIQLVSVLLTESRSTLHTDNGDYTTWEKNTFKSGTGLISKTTYSTSDGMSHTATFGYEAQGAMGNWLKDKNITGELTECETTYGDKTLRVTSTFSRDATGMTRINSTRTLRNGIVAKEEKYLYDNYGNIREISRSDSSTITYLWGYDGMSPVYAVNGQSFAVVDRSTGNMAGETSAETLVLGSIPGAYITRMEWRPLIGPVSVTDSTGMRTAMEYDRYGRISKISIDGKGTVEDSKYENYNDRVTILKNKWIDASGIHKQRTMEQFDGFHRKIIEATDLHDGLNCTQAAILTEYDRMGRPFRRWAASPVTALKPTSAQIKDAAVLFHGDHAPYTDTEFEQSPREIAVGQTREGAVWHSLGKKSTKRILTNDLSSYQCPRYNVSSQGVRKAGSYDKGMLVVEETTDEDGFELRVYSDMRGLKVMESRGSKGKWLHTRYVYDGFGQLLYILPPKLGDDELADTKKTDALAYSYSYDGKGNIVSRKLPGRKKIVYRYDTLGRLLAEQDGNTAPDWTVYLYDKFGREVVCAASDWTESELASFCSTPCIASYTGTGDIGGYSLKTALPAPLKEIYVSHVFNDKGQLIKEDAGITGTSYEYDKFGQPSKKIKTYFKEKPGSGVVSSEKPIVETTEYHYTYTGSVDTCLTTYSGRDIYIPSVMTVNRYDVLGRMKEQWVYRHVDRHPKRVLGDSVAAIRIEYDGVGRVNRKLLGDRMEHDLRIDVHGWLVESGLTLKIGKESVDKEDGDTVVVPFRSSAPFANNDKLLPGPDPFNPYPEVLKRRSVIEKIVYGNSSGGFYNGNISMRIDREGTYSYSYDAFNRLVSAQFTSNTGDDADYSTEYSYDEHANITSVTRKGITDIYGGSKTYGTLDDICLTLDGNKTVGMASSTEASAYEGRAGLGADGSFSMEYDDNGNLVSDSGRGISSITYNRLGQPTVITFADGRRITNQYDGVGTLLSRSVRPGGRLPRTTTEHFVGPHRGNFSSSAVAKSACHTDFAGGYFDGSDKAHYLVADYRGNIVRDCRADGTVVASAEYYPYGEPRTEPTGDNRKWTEGNERLSSSGLPVTDYGPRLMDHARIGWSRPDRLLESTPWLFPYSYCAGNPVALTDPSGDLLCLTVAGVEYCYQYGDQGWGFYNGEELLNFWDADEFVQELYKAISFLMSGPVGFALIESIVNSNVKVYVEPVIRGHDLFGNTCFYRDNNHIYWDIKKNQTKSFLINSDGTYGDSGSKIMFNLGHELSHAIFAINGYDYRSFNNIWFFSNGRPIYTDEKWTVFVENYLRFEHNASLRVGYGLDYNIGFKPYPLRTLFPNPNLNNLIFGNNGWILNYLKNLKH